MKVKDMVQVIEYQTEYPSVNLNMVKLPKIYDMSIIVLYTMKLEKGYIVKNIGKTTRKGTKVTYKVIESEEELKEYIKKVNKIIEDYNNKYNTNFSLFD